MFEDYLPVLRYQAIAMPRAGTQVVSLVRRIHHSPKRLNRSSCSVHYKTDGKRYSDEIKMVRCTVGSVFFLR